MLFFLVTPPINYIGGKSYVTGKQCYQKVFENWKEFFNFIGYNRIYDFLHYNVLCAMFIGVSARGAGGATASPRRKTS